MPNILITEITPDTKISAKGEALTGLFVKGTQLIDQHNFSEKPWEKFYFDFTEEPAFFENVEVGDAVKIKNVRDGKFWKLDSVTPLEAIQRSTPASAPPDSPVVAAVVAPPKTVAQYREPAVLVRADACKLAVEIGVAFLSNDKYKKTATTELILEDILETAKRFNYFMENKQEDNQNPPPSIKGSGTSKKQKQGKLPLKVDEGDTTGDESPDPDDIPF